MQAAIRPRRARTAASLVAAWMLAGCAGVAPVPVAPLLHDEAFAVPAEPVDASDLFALDEAMQRYVDAEILPRARRRDLRRVLIDALYRRGALQLEYDSARTRTAAEAYAARAGNCLSLVIMTAAFARAVGLPVRFQRVATDEVWSRSGTLVFASGHVNLALGRPLADRGRAVDTAAWLAVDFVPDDGTDPWRSTEIDAGTVVAMYQNNRAAESLAAGALDAAYAWARAALLRAPAYASALNTLALVYERRGLRDAAEQVLLAALANAGESANLLSNLANLYRAGGRDADAARIEQRRARIEAQPPFAWFNRGVQAMREERYALARELFERELRRDPDYHEFHFWLALAQAALGETAAARHELAAAMRASTTARERGIYAAKLDRLNARR